METRIEVIWAELDALAVALGDPKATAAALARNRELMLTYWRTFEAKLEAQKVPNGVAKAPTQPKA